MRGVGTAIKVGLFFAVILVASYLMFKRVGESYKSADTKRYYALFKDGAGLVSKSQVMIAGLPAGKIHSRSIQDNRARIDVLVDGRYTLYENAVIYKKSISLMGQYYLEIDPGTEYSPNPKDPKGPPIRNRVLGDGDRIRHVVEAVGVNDLMPQMQQLVRTVNDLMARDVRQVIQALRRDISDLLAEVKKLTKGPLTDTVRGANQVVRQVGQQVDRLVRQLNAIASDVRPMTRDAAKDVVAILRDVRSMTGRLRRTVDPQDPNQKGLLDRLDRIAARLDKAVDRVSGRVEKAADDVPAITGDVRKVTRDLAEGRGIVGSFITDEALASSVKESIYRTGDFLKTVIGLRTIVGLRSEYNVLANSLKTYLAIRLQPSADKYYLIELIDDPRGNRSVTQTVTRTDDPSEPPVKHTETVEVTEKFRISFQFAKRVGFATFRFGIKESTGGVGLDLAFFRDRLVLQTDLFNFQANVFPRLKVSAAWMFYKRLYLVAGADDVLNARGRTGAGGGRDYFLGAMLQFDDKDLTALLLFAGSALTGASGN